MAFTDHCDVFASFHEDGFNRILEHLQRQRPSMFNYATRQIAQNPELLCRVINAHPRLKVIYHRHRVRGDRESFSDISHALGGGRLYSYRIRGQPG